MQTDSFCWYHWLVPLHSKVWYLCMLCGKMSAGLKRLLPLEDVNSSITNTNCVWMEARVSVRNCGGAVQFALAGFQRLPPALLHRKKRWRNSGFCTSSPASTTAGLRRWCCRWSALVKVAVSPSRGGSRRSARQPWTSARLFSCRWAGGDGFFHTQTGNLHPQRRQQWCAAGEGLAQTSGKSLLPGNT